MIIAADITPRWLDAAANAAAFRRAMPPPLLRLS